MSTDWTNITTSGKNVIGVTSFRIRNSMQVFRGIRLQFSRECVISLNREYYLDNEYDIASFKCRYFMDL